MRQPGKYYEHSGAFEPKGIVYMIGLGGVSAMVLGLIYGYAINYIPFIYINFFITIGFGAGVGLVTGYGGKLGKVRNYRLLIIMGLLMGLFAEYSGWVSWIYAVTKQQVLIFRPSHLLNSIKVIAQGGVWTIFGWTPKGFALYTVWGIEAVMIIGIATALTWGLVGATPFCEKCSKWVEEIDVFSPLAPIKAVDDFKYKLELGDMTPLKELARIDSGLSPYVHVELLHCPGCNQNYFLTVKSVVITKDKDDKEKKNETTIMENLIISGDQYQALKESFTA